MGKIYNPEDRHEAVKTLLKDPVFRGLHSLVDGPELPRKYINKLQEERNSGGLLRAFLNFLAYYSFHRKIGAAQQLQELEHQRLDELKIDGGIFPRFPITDADSLPFYVKGRNSPRGYISRYDNSQDLDRLVVLHN